MSDLYKVAVHYGNDCGYVEYAVDKKQARVVLADDEKRGEVEKYLAEEHVIPVANATLRDFSPKSVKPLESVDNFKLALTRLWNETGVHVDWSRPV